MDFWNNSGAGLADSVACADITKEGKSALTSGFLVICVSSEETYDDDTRGCSHLAINHDRQTAPRQAILQVEIAGGSWLLLSH